MKVKIRKWKSMKKEFGLDADGDINIKPCFTKEMKYLCGKKIKVINKNFYYEENYYEENGFRWFITEQMITKKYKHLFKD